MATRAMSFMHIRDIINSITLLKNLKYCVFKWVHLQLSLMSDDLVEVKVLLSHRK